MQEILKVFTIPIFECTKIESRARITGNEHYGANWYSACQYLLSNEYGADGVGMKMISEIIKGAARLLVAKLKSAGKVGYISVALWTHQTRLHSWPIHAYIGIL